MSCRDRLRIILFALCALFAVVACEEEAPTQAEAAPTPTPVPTAAVAEQFSADAMPLPGKEWLSKFSHMLSAVPVNHGPVLFLDLKELRYKPDVQAALRSQIAPALAAIPSAVTNVIEGAVLATSGNVGGVFVVLTTPLDIGTMLNAASSLQITSKLPEPEAYRDHQIWTFNEFETSLAIGSVDATTSVAAAGSPPSDISPSKRVKSALDTVDGLTPRLLDSSAVSQVVNRLPQGIVVAVFDGCSGLGSQPGIGGLLDCSVMGVSAELLDQNVVAINIVAAFQEDGLAKAALLTLNDAELRLAGSVTQDSASRQEGSLVLVRQIIEFDQIGDLFDAFGRP